MSIAHQNAHTIIRDILSKQHIERVWFVGCGGSLTGFWPGKYFLDCEAKKLAVGYVTSNEFVHATPNALGKNSVVILASQQGNTAETVEAARIARQKGAATIGLVYPPARRCANTAITLLNTAGRAIPKPSIRRSKKRHTACGWRWKCLRKLRDTPITMRWSAPLPVLNPWYAALSSRFRRMRAILPKPGRAKKSST